MAQSASRALTAAIAAAGMASLLATTACYTYTVAAPADVPVGRVIDVSVTSRGRAALTNDIGDDVTMVEGTFVSANDSVLKINATSAEFVLGNTAALPGISVAIPRDGILLVKEKDFSRAKSAMIGVGLAAAVVAAIAAFGLNGLGGGSSDSKPPNPGGLQ